MSLNNPSCEGARLHSDSSRSPIHPPRSGFVQHYAQPRSLRSLDAARYSRAAPVSSTLCFRRPPLQIVLMRHGKPKIDMRLRLNAAEFGAWVEQYNAAGIDTECLPPQGAVAQAKQCAFTVCSNLPRSLESANALGVERIGNYSSMFREFDMPHAAWRFPNLSLQAWLVFFRLAWALGYSTNAESFKSAKARAHSCAEQLTDLASTHGTVLFVGHGSLNWFVTRYLKRMGWLSAERPPKKYWEHSVFYMQET